MSVTPDVRAEYITARRIVELHTFILAQSPQTDWCLVRLRRIVYMLENYFA